MKYPFYTIEPVQDTRGLFERCLKHYADRIIFKEYTLDRTLIALSYKDFLNQVEALGTALLNNTGVGKHFGILGDNSIGWVQAYLSVITGLGVAVPLDKEMTEDILEQLIKKGDCDYLFVSNRFFPMAQRIFERVDRLERLIVIDPQYEVDYGEHWLLSQLIEFGRQLRFFGDRSYTELPIDHNALCEILFTSGTTGANKGVMLSQKNLATVINGAVSVISPPGETISLLPISHAYECSCHILGGMYLGATICFNDSLKNVSRNFALFQPNFTLVVPMILESFHRQIWKSIQNNHLTKHVQYGLAVSNLIRRFGIDQRRFYFKPIHQSFGGNFHRIVCGGAPLAPDLAQNLIDLGIEVVNGYGITECGPLVSCSRFDWKKKVGSVGRPIPDCNVRISQEGEIQVKGGNVMLGYYGDPAATKDSFTDDGWLRTGDIGRLDKDGFLYVDGRLKNLIILPNGKNVHPEMIEGLLSKKLSYVKESIVYANGDHLIKAACYLDPEFFQAHGEKSLDILRQDVRRFNQLMPAYMQIGDIELVETEFIKTTTRKIKRHLYKGV